MPALIRGYRQGCQDGVAVLFLLDPKRRLEAGLHAQTPGQFMRLINAIGASPSDVDLLQSYDIGGFGGDHRHDASQVQAAVRALCRCVYCR